MMTTDRKATDRLRAQRVFFSLWMALAALMVIVTMAAGFATSSNASELIDPMTTSAIASAPISRASDKPFIIALVVLGFATMAVGGIALTLTSLREGASRTRRH